MNTASYIYNHFDNSQAEPFIEFLVQGTKNAAKTDFNGDVSVEHLLQILGTRDAFLREMFRKYVITLLKEKQDTLVLGFPLSEQEEREILSYVKPKLNSYLTSKIK